MKYFYIFATVLSLSLPAMAQKPNDQEPRYKASAVVDPEYGILRYNPLVPAIGGDSVRRLKGGYIAQGWVEDYYESGKLLHRGFYVDGKISLFKNYFENGQMERSFTSSDLRHSKVEIFYENGKPRSTVFFYNGNAQKQYDYYENGNPEYLEENDKSMDFLNRRCFYYESGLPRSIFEMVDKKTKKYTMKEYYENGKLKEEGIMFFRKDLNDYVKDGEWSSFDENGNVVKKETYQNGEKV